jgi:hypothetical protein
MNVKEEVVEEVANVVRIIIAILFSIVIISALSLMTETNDVEDRDTIRQVAD